MAGKVGRSGRKKVTSTLVNKALEHVDQHIPELFNKLVEKALQGDRECLIYLIDRRLGKPKAATEITGSELTGGIIVKLAVPPYDESLRLEQAKTIETQSQLKHQHPTTLLRGRGLL